MKKYEFEIKTTAAAVSSRIEQIEKLINNDEEFEKLTKKELLKLELELCKLQSDALALKEYFIPLEYAYRHANICKALIKLINERLNQEYKILLGLRNYLREKVTQSEYAEIVSAIKQSLK